MKRLIAFEGIDGSGKSYQIKLLKKWFDERLEPYKTIGDLSSTEIGRLLSVLIVDRHKHYEMDELDLLLLFTVGRRCMVREVMDEVDDRWNVICDRYIASNYAYLVHELGHEKIFEEISKYIQWPDLIYWIDTPVDKCLERLARDRTPVDRFDRDATKESLERKRRGYLKLYEQYKHFMVRLDGSQSASLIHQEVKRNLYALMD